MKNNQNRSPIDTVSSSAADRRHHGNFSSTQASIRAESAAAPQRAMTAVNIFVHEHRKAIGCARTD
jgi:hypothetical protein